MTLTPMHSPRDAEALPAEQLEMLIYLASVPGCDVWEGWYAGDCRTLEKLGLIRIVKARGAPKNGAERQPYFGAKITAAGRRFLEREMARA